jgi:hypothetical protein
VIGCHALPELVRVAEFVTYERVQVHRQDERDLATGLCVGAAMSAQRQLAEGRLHLRALQGDSFRGSPVYQRYDFASKAFRGLGYQGHFSRAGQGTSG